MQQQPIQEVYSHLIPLSGSRLIVPRASVREVMGFTMPTDRPANAPNWLLGMIDWHGSAIPVVSFEAACDREVPELGRRTRIAVIQCFSGLLDPPVFALVTQGYPYLVRVNAIVLQFDEQGASNLRGPILTAAKMANERPLVPDLEKIESMLADALGIEAKAMESAPGNDVLDGMEDVDVGDGDIDSLEIDTGGIEVEDTGNDLDLGLGDDLD